MKRIRYIAIFFIIAALLLQIGCSTVSKNARQENEAGVEQNAADGAAGTSDKDTSSGKTDGNEHGTGEGANDEKAGNEADEEADNQEIKHAFDELIKNDDITLEEIIGFLDENMGKLSKNDASALLIRFEELQKENLSSLEEQYFSEGVQNKIYNTVDPGSPLDLDNIDSVKDPELKELLVKTRDSGYKVETAEGMYFPVLDYEFYKKYAAYTNDDIKEYVDLMAVESNKVPAKDAALMIGWDELVKRALKMEEFIFTYVDSVKFDDVKDLYDKYVNFIIYGLNNTPLFSYDKKTMNEKARAAYTDVVREPGDSRLLQILKDYLKVIENNNYTLTDEVETYRTQARDNLQQLGC